MGWLKRKLWQRQEERRIDAQIRELGWTGTYLGDYGKSPTWCYSVGFEETLQHPELIVFDIPEPDAKQLFWVAFEALKAGSSTIADGLPFEEFTEDGIGPVWRQVHPSRVSGEGWLAFACSRRTRRKGAVEGMRAFQCVLPDPAGKFPWDEGYDESLRPRQPALWLPFEEDTGGRYMLAAMGLIPPSAISDLLPASLREPGRL